MSHINSFSFFATIFFSTKQNFTANVTAGLSCLFPSTNLPLMKTFVRKSFN